MDSQKDLAWKMRGILTDWLIQVHTRFRLLTETLYRAVNIIDRFLSARVVYLAKLLVGITCVFLAAKVEEIVAPSAVNFLYCADSDQKSRRPPPPARTSLPALAAFHFQGVSEYLEEFVARIDAPLLTDLSLTVPSSINRYFSTTHPIRQSPQRARSLKKRNTSSRRSSGTWATQTQFTFFVESAKRTSTMFKRVLLPNVS